MVLGSCALTPSVAPAGTQYDGVYIGQDRLLSGVTFQCGAPDLPEMIAVRNGRFDYPFQVSPPRVAPLPVEIGSNGEMVGQMQYGTGEEIPGLSRDRVDWVYLRGQISGTTINATITTIRCARRLVGQHSND